MTQTHVNGCPQNHPPTNEKQKMTRRGNGYLDEATERLREEQEKEKDPKTVYEDQMLERRDEDE